MQEIKLKNEKSIPKYLDTLFVCGQLDEAIINIPIGGHVLKREKVNKPVYYRLLLPVTQILCRWRCKNMGTAEGLCEITYGDQTCKPLTDRKSVV